MIVINVPSDAAKSMSKAWEQVTPNVVNLGDLAGGLEDPQADVLGVDIRFDGIFHDIVW